MTKKKVNYNAQTSGAVKVSGLRVLGTNSLKTIKGQKRGVLTGILYLAPHTTANARTADGQRVNVCPNATPGCMAGCLYRSGAALFAKNVNAARVRKTRAFVSDPAAFVADIVADIERIERVAAKHSMRVAVRLNGTSDLRWERIPVSIPTDGNRFGRDYPNIMSAFPDVAFYDYTKRTDRGPLPPNYALVFSRSETNDRDCVAVLARGINVAVVFSTGRKQPLPNSWNGYRVIDGDADDLRFADDRGVVIGLRAKAYARKDATGFVVAV